MKFVANCALGLMWVRMLVVEVLNESGSAPLEAADGNAALKILQSSAKADLLVTDVGLSEGFNGRQVADGALAAWGIGRYRSLLDTLRMRF